MAQQPACYLVLTVADHSAVTVLFMAKIKSIDYYSKPVNLKTC